MASEIREDTYDVDRNNKAEEDEEKGCPVQKGMNCEP